MGPHERLQRKTQAVVNSVRWSVFHVLPESERARAQKIVQGVISPAECEEYRTKLLQREQEAFQTNYVLQARKGFDTLISLRRGHAKTLAYLHRMTIPKLSYKLREYEIKRLFTDARHRRGELKEYVSSGGDLPSPDPLDP